MQYITIFGLLGVFSLGNILTSRKKEHCFLQMRFIWSLNTNRLQFSYTESMRYSLLKSRVKVSCHCHKMGLNQDVHALILYWISFHWHVINLNCQMVFSNYIHTYIYTHTHIYIYILKKSVEMNKGTIMLLQATARVMHLHFLPSVPMI